MTTKRGPQTPLGCYMRNGTTSDPVIIAIVSITILSTLDQLWHSTILTKVFATSLNVETFNRWVIRKGWCNFIEPQVYFWPYCSPVDQTSRQLSYPFQKAYSPMNKASDGENVRAKCRKLKKKWKMRWMTLTLFDIFYIVKSYIGLGLRLVKYSFFIV